MGEVELDWDGVQMGRSSGGVYQSRCWDTSRFAGARCVTGIGGVNADRPKGWLCSRFPSLAYLQRLLVLATQVALGINLRGSKTIAMYTSTVSCCGDRVQVQQWIPHVRSGVPKGINVLEQAMRQRGTKDIHSSYVRQFPITYLGIGNENIVLVLHL